MQIKIPSLGVDQKIPPLYTCHGKGIHPEILIEKVPPLAKSLSLIMEDPDVPLFVREDGMWVHWVLFNLPPHLKKIEEGILPPGVSGKNTEGELGYQGPCPPDREHRYFFKLYALDQMLDLAEGASKEELLLAMEGHLLSYAECVGLYQPPCSS